MKVSPEVFTSRKFPSQGELSKQKTPREKFNPRPKKCLYASQLQILYVNKVKILWLTYPSPGAVVGHIIPKDIVTELFNYAEQNGYLKIFDWTPLRKKGRWEGASCRAILLVTKKGTRIFNFPSNEPFPDILGLLFRCNRPWEDIPPKISSGDLSSDKK